MKRLVVCLCTSLVWTAVAADETDRKPPKRASEPFAIFIDASPRGEESVVEDILDATEELEETIAEKKKWFQVTESPDEAEIAVDVKAYWVREQTRIHDQRHVAGGNTHTVQVTTIYRHHSLRAIVTIFGTPREMTGAQTKRNGGSAEGAASDLADKIERYVKDNYWELEERRKLRAEGS